MHARASNYDAFISYSSADERYVRFIQRFIERYRPPKKIADKRTRLKLFRDKDDQGISENYESSFYEWIDKIPGFILFASDESLKSQPVSGEVAQAIKKASPNIYLAWIDKSKPKFPEAVSNKYPKAIYSNFSVLRKTNWLKWLLKDRKVFRTEALRLIAKLLSLKLHREVSQDELVRRDNQRSLRRNLVAVSIAGAFLASISIYFFSTPAYAWQHTELFDKDISHYQLKIINGEPKLWITNEIFKPWEDETNGDSGNDSDISFYQLNEHGQIEGTIVYHTCDVERELCGEAPKAYGVFSKLNEDSIKKIIASAFEHESTEKYDTALSIYAKPSFEISPYHNGTVYMSAVKDEDRFDPKGGGIFRTIDDGKNWEPLKMEMWNSFADITFDFNATTSFAVILAQITGTNLNFPLNDPALLPSVWLTSDNGNTWKQVPSNRQNIDVKNLDLIWLKDKNLAGLIPRNNSARQLIIYKKRTIRDRLLQKFDDF